MKKVIAFGASNSKESINQKLAIWTANQLENTEVIDLDLNDYEMPLYGVDFESEYGVPELARQFKSLINEADGIIISFAEHNGSYSVAFKNVLDWISRLEKPVWSNKPMFLMATSPGPRGALNVLNTAVNTFPYQGADVIGHFSLPSFNKHFSDNKGITEDSLRETLLENLQLFERRLYENSKVVI